MEINDWVDDPPGTSAPVVLWNPKDEAERDAAVKDVFEPDEITDWQDDPAPAQAATAQPMQDGPFTKAIMDIGGNTIENIKDTATATGAAMSEPWIGPHTPPRS